MPQVTFNGRIPLGEAMEMSLIPYNKQQMADIYLADIPGQTFQEIKRKTALVTMITGY